MGARIYCKLVVMKAALYSLRTVYLPLARLDELSPNILDGLEELDLIV